MHAASAGASQPAALPPSHATAAASAPKGEEDGGEQIGGRSDQEAASNE